MKILNKLFKRAKPIKINNSFEFDTNFKQIFTSQYRPLLPVDYIGYFIHTPYQAKEPKIDSIKIVGYKYTFEVDAHGNVVSEFAYVTSGSYYYNKETELYNSFADAQIALAAIKIDIPNE